MSGHVESQKRQFELAPSLPAHLPAPPSPSSSHSGGGGGGSSNLILGIPNPVPPQNNPPIPGLGPPSDDLAPFGLNHIILILVPQFKTKFRNLPDWLNSNVKVSMPITVFFDKLVVPPAFAPIMKPLINPLLMPPFGRPIPPPGSGFGQYPFPFPHENSEEDDDLENDENPEDDADNDSGSDNESQNEDAEAGSEGYEHGYGYEHEAYEESEKRALTKSKRRRKRSVILGKTSSLPVPPTGKIHSRRKRAVTFNKTVHSTERAVLLPKLERLLDSAGLGGKSCLLRTICEVHEAPLHHYGLLGQLFTMFFSVSRSIFADTHLPEYLQAERKGKTGNCSEYYIDCGKTMFSWEESHISDYNEIF
ncbi:unnamed protein product [Orchesella dallaii]|uniref:Uncharacterized protein n=1 Tax=Orchesella dallaii TaxID=48710 RepID=A0ABP1QPQ6_9HEXA